MTHKMGEKFAVYIHDKDLVSRSKELLLLEDKKTINLETTKNKGWIDVLSNIGAVAVVLHSRSLSNSWDKVRFTEHQICIAKEDKDRACLNVGTIF